MNRWDAEPLKGVNGIRFGMKREDVRSRLGDYREFKKSKYSKTTSDDFKVCHVFYDASDNCEAIEIFRGVDVFISDHLIFPTDIEAVRKIVPDLVEDEGSYISKGQSIGIYAPDGNAESILFGSENYYG